MSDNEKCCTDCKHLSTNAPKLGKPCLDVMRLKLQFDGREDALALCEPFDCAYFESK